MNVESTSNRQRTPSTKVTSRKRGSRTNRPVLVTEQPSAAPIEDPVQPVEEVAPVAQVAPEEQSAATEQQPASKEAAARRGPRFFTSLLRTEKSADQPQADPQTVRLARALRSQGIDTSKEKGKEKKAADNEKKTAVGTSKAGASTTPARPKSGFKTKYLMGMMIYLLVTELVGQWLTGYMQANHLDVRVFAIGSFEFRSSMLLFLAILIVVLIVLVRLDLIPRSLGAMVGAPSPKNAASAAKAKTPTFESKEDQPSIKQGVKGSDDALYREYRENQRYFQKRDRKR